MKPVRLLLIALSWVMVPVIVQGQMPRILSYQGVLTDTVGNPKPDGLYNFTFRLYDASTGGTAIWTEVKDLQVNGGLFSTLLGDVTPFGSEVAFDKPYWLGIKPGADPELQPRVELSSVGYSFHSERADTAAYALNGPGQAFVDSARIAGTIPDGTVTTSKLGNNAVTSQKIASGVIVKSLNTLRDDVTLAAGTNVTITPNGDTLTIAALGGGTGDVSGTGAAGQVPFWTGASTIGGDNGLFWDNTNKRLGVGTNSPAYSLHAETATGRAIYGEATATTGTNYGGFFQSFSTNGRGVYGQAPQIGVHGVATGATGTNYGGYFESASTNGRSVFGYAISNSGTNYGGYFETNSTAGRALYGNASAITGTNYGGYFESASINGLGVYGIATATSGTNYGGFFASASTSGRGVYGAASAATGLTFAGYFTSSSTSGRGVYGYAAATTGTNYGGYFESNSTSGFGVYGAAPAISGATYGVYGRSASSSGYGVYGLAASTTGVNFGVYGQTASVDGRAVSGLAGTTTGVNYGLWGQSNSIAGTGVYGRAFAATGTTYGVHGVSNSSSGYGVYGDATSTTGQNYGGYFQSASSTGTGVYGNATATTGVNFGVRGVTLSSSGQAVFGSATATTGSNFGIYGYSASSNGTGVYGQSPSKGVSGIATATTGVNYGVIAQSFSSSGRGVYGLATATTGTNYGVYGESASSSGIGVYGVAPSGGYAVYCDGSFRMTTGTFWVTPTTTTWATNKPATVKLNDGTKVKLFSEEAAELFFTDYGEGTLSEGTTHIELDPVFLQTVTIDANHPLKVFVQLEADCKGIYVTNKTATGFDVVELQGGTSNAAFCYRVVCKRKYYEDERLATEEEDIMYNTRMLKKAWPEVIAEQQAEKAEHLELMGVQKAGQERSKAEEQLGTDQPPQ